MIMEKAYRWARYTYPGDDYAVFLVDIEDQWYGYAVFNREGPVAFFNQDPDTSNVQVWDHTNDGHTYPGEPAIDELEDDILEGYERHG